MKGASYQTLIIAGIFCFLLGKADCQVLQLDLISKKSDGASAGNQASTKPVISGDGKFIAFCSDANDLVSFDGNTLRDVFIYERSTGLTTLMSTDLFSTVANGDACIESPSSGEKNIAISQNGDYIAFSSDAANFNTIPADTNLQTDVFLKYRVTGTIIRASSDELLGDANGPSYHPSLNSEGLLVAFDSEATNLIEDVNGSVRDVFLKNMMDFSIELISQSSSDEQGDDESGHPELSGDGDLVTFLSRASNLVSGAQSVNSQVLLRIRPSRETVRVSQNSAGEPANSDCSPSKISRDGNLIVFASAASNLDSKCSGGNSRQLFLYDRTNSADPSLRCITVAKDGSEGDADSGGGSDKYDISADGRYIVFESNASNLVPGSGSDTKIIRYDSQKNEFVLISQTVQGQAADSKAVSPDVTDDGQIAVFSSNASNLVAEDQNLVSDIYAVLAGSAERKLKKNTKIEAPPGVSVQGDDATITMQKFKKASVKSSKARQLALSARGAAKTSLRYVVTITNSNVANDIRKLRSKKSVLTARDLPSGDYTVKYKINVFRDGKKAFSTNSSPSAAFSISP
ncbi:MAG: hypothetical protein DCC75_09475 [Proteobacteria bacterium]|nr:MAG: hypothetical protein DCC75_09475 [Pseudomonadota bacterium]